MTNYRDYLIIESVGFDTLDDSPLLFQHPFFQPQFSSIPPFSSPKWKIRAYFTGCGQKGASIIMPSSFHIIPKRLFSNDSSLAHHNSLAHDAAPSGRYGHIFHLGIKGRPSPHHAFPRNPGTAVFPAIHTPHTPMRSPCEPSYAPIPSHT